MKKSKNNIIQDWLDNNSNKEIEEQVKREIKDGVPSPIVTIKKHK